MLPRITTRRPHVSAAFPHAGEDTAKASMYVPVRRAVWLDTDARVTATPERTSTNCKRGNTAP